MPSKQQETILILDLGSQYVQLIARRVRENNIYSHIVSHNINVDEVVKLNPKGIILSGGPASVYAENTLNIDPKIFDLNIPILGICYGMHLIAKHYGLKVQSSSTREYGRATLNLEKLSNSDQLFSNVEDKSQAWMSHGDRVENVEVNFDILAKTNDCPIAAIKHKTSNIYGIQFHPEVTHSSQGMKILQNFLKKICSCSCSWTMSNYIEQATKEIREKVGKDKVICGLSGGVDSAVVAALLAKAIGDQLHCILVDNGLMRKNEIPLVVKRFKEHFPSINLHVAEAESLFLSKLKGISEPQTKRKIIGNTFIDVFSEEAAKIKSAKYLAQGTIYPDVIESGGSADAPADTIKLHHNVGGLPENLEFDLIEPLRELFKDEVRRLGEELGLPKDMVWRHPFPGPGLAIRCIGEVTKDNLNVLRDADEIAIEEIRKANLYDKTSQAFVVLLPVKSVGVMGDGRTYENAIALRCVSTDDFMTADWTHLPYELLAKISNRIINEVSGVNRVVYDISSKPPATIEWE